MPRGLLLWRRRALNTQVGDFAVGREGENALVRLAQFEVDNVEELIAVYGIEPRDLQVESQLFGIPELLRQLGRSIAAGIGLHSNSLTCSRRLQSIDHLRPHTRPVD